MKLTKEQRFGIISSIIFLVLFIGLLLLFGFSAPFPPPEEEGILINFGTNETGSGTIEPRPTEQPVEQVSNPEPVSAPEPVQQANNTEEIVTQDFEKTAVIEEKKKQEELKRKKEEQEIERKRQEEIEIQKKAEQERKKKEEQQKAINERAKNAFGGKNPTGDNTGEGVTNGTGNQGKPEGDINSNNRNGGAGGNGISFSLSGRSHKLLPAPPKIHTTEGKVVVEVTVDQNGNVVSARPGVKGSTISDEALWKVAKEAALKATFSVNKNAPALQKGTITYFFGFE